MYFWHTKQKWPRIFLQTGKPILSEIVYAPAAQIRTIHKRLQQSNYYLTSAEPHRPEHSALGRRAYKPPFPSFRVISSLERRDRLEWRKQPEEIFRGRRRDILCGELGLQSEFNLEKITATVCLSRAELEHVAGSAVIIIFERCFLESSSK